MYSQLASKAAKNIHFLELSVSHGPRQPKFNHTAATGLYERISSGGTIFSEGDNAKNVYAVIRGVLRLYKLLPDGRRQITGFVFPGQLTGLAPGGCYIYSAEAITDAMLRRYPRARFEQMIEEVPGLAQRLLTATSDELGAAQDQMLLLGRKSAAEKIASFLLKMAEWQGGDDSGVDRIHIPMGRGDIADYLGLTKETVCKILSKLKRDGAIVSPSNSRIELRKREYLEELAAGELAENLQRT